MGAAEPATTNRTTVSIGTKLTLATSAVLVVVSTLLYRELTHRERQNLVAAKETAAAMVADLFAASLGAPLDFEDQDAVHTELEHLEKNPEVTCAAVFSHDSLTPMAEVKRGCDASRPVSSEDVARPLRHDERVEVARVVTGRADARVGTARIVFSLARENAAYAASRARIFWLSLLLALGTAAVLAAISRTQIVRPLHRLAEAARRVGGGDFSTNLVVSSRDELGELATAFNRMREEIADREQRLAAVTHNLRELFDHMGQAIVAFDCAGKVRGEVSREASKIFDASGRGGLEGSAIGTLLFGENTIDVEAQAFEEWRAMAFDAASTDWNQLAELAPHEVNVRTPAGSVVPLELEFRPVTKDGALDRVMLLASDVSEKKRLELAIDVQEEEHKKRMAAMRRLVAGGAQLFVQFIEGARARLDTTRLQARDGDVDAQALSELFRHVHTLKGEARAFELAELASALEAIEDTLAKLQAGRSRSDGASLEAGIERARSAIDLARADFVAASPIGDAALEQITVRRSDLQAVLSIARGRDPVLAQAAARLASRPFGESMTTLVARATEWAARDGKRIELIVEGRDVRVPPRLAEVLGGVMNHLLRNAIAHGIESPDERLRSDKDEAGSVWVSAHDGPLGPSIVVEDDGRGIDEPAVVERARSMGVDVSSEGDVELVFVPGLSTRQSADGLSGRGVGLDAVRAYLREAGYRIHFVTEPTRGTKFVIEPNPAAFAPS